MTPSWNPRRHVFDRQVLTHWHKWSCGFMRRSARRLARRLLYFLSTESNQGGARRTRKAANPSRRKMDLAARLSPDSCGRILTKNSNAKDFLTPTLPSPNPSNCTPLATRFPQAGGIFLRPCRSPSAKRGNAPPLAWRSGSDMRINAARPGLAVRRGRSRCRRRPCAG
jgi:hypothetical protein